MIFKDTDAISAAYAYMSKHLKDYGFEQKYINNSIKTPYNNGYRDINLRLQDNTNKGLIGELQFQLCSIQKFKTLVGHKIYEIMRELKPNQANIKKILTNVSKYGYDQAIKMPNSGCIANFSTRGGGGGTSEPRELAAIAIPRERTKLIH